MSRDMELILVNSDEDVVVAGRPRGACEPRRRKGPKVKHNLIGITTLPIERIVTFVDKICKSIHKYIYIYLIIYTIYVYISPASESRSPITGWRDQSIKSESQQATLDSSCRCRRRRQPLTCVTSGKLLLRRGRIGLCLVVSAEAEVGFSS